MTVETIVKVAQAAVRQGDGKLVTIGLGSCVAILLYDRVARVGGMAHILLPDTSSARDASNPAKFATTAVAHLTSEMNQLGADLKRIQARLVGGASMFPGSTVTATLNMGERNIAAARATLLASRIPILGEDVGAAHGRSVRFSVIDGTVVVSSAFRDDVIL